MQTCNEFPWHLHFYIFSILIQNKWSKSDIVFAPTTSNIHHCPTSNIVLKVHHVGCVGFLTHLLTSFVFPKFHSKWLIPTGKTIIISAISASLSMIFNNPKYGVLLIDSHIFFLEVLIKCSFKELPTTLWKLLLELVISLRLYSRRVLAW